MASSNRSGQGALDLGDTASARELQRARWAAEPLKAFEEWRRNKRAANQHGFGDRTIEQHTAMWAAFLKYLAKHNHTFQTVHPDGVEAFLKQLVGRPIKDNERSRLPLAPGDSTTASHSTVNRYTKLLAETFEHLADLKVRRGNPVAPVQRIYTKPEAPPAVEFLNKEQETALFAYIEGLPTEDWKDERDRAILYLLLASGPTVGELARLRMDDLQIGDLKPMAMLSSHDLTHAHAAPIGEFALPALVSWKNRRRAMFDAYELLRLEAGPPPQPATVADPNNPKKKPPPPWPPGNASAIPGSILFPSAASNGAELESSVVYNIVRDALDAIRFPGKIRGPQTLRNTFARRQLFHDADPVELSRWLGLTSQKTVNKILRTLPGTQKSKVF